MPDTIVRGQGQPSTASRVGENQRDKERIRKVELLRILAGGELDGSTDIGVVVPSPGILGRGTDVVQGCMTVGR